MSGDMVVSHLSAQSLALVRLPVTEKTGFTGGAADARAVLLALLTVKQS